jgi:hypothetical protein
MIRFEFTDVSHTTISIVRAHNEESRRRDAGAADRRRHLEEVLATIVQQIDRAVAAVIEDRITKEEADRLGQAHEPRPLTDGLWERGEGGAG